MNHPERIHQTPQTNRPIMDIDLPIEHRTEANMYKALYYEALSEVRKSNKGVKRLHDKLAFHKNQILGYKEGKLK